MPTNFYFQFIFIIRRSICATFEYAYKYIFKGLMYIFLQISWTDAQNKVMASIKQYVPIRILFHTNQNQWVLMTRKKNRMSKN